MDAATRPARSRGPEVVLDSRQLRVLAHPLRSRLLGQLRLDGPATATRLAEVLDTNTGATSYHLRQLGDVGLVVDEPGQGRGRERWWRAAHATSSWSPEAFDADPDDRAAADWLLGNAVRHLGEQVRHWTEVRTTYPREWQRAAELSDYFLRLSPARLRALNDDLEAVVRRHQAAAAEEDAPDAEQVLVYLYGFPRGEGR